MHSTGCFYLALVVMLISATYTWVSGQSYHALFVIDTIIGKTGSGIDVKSNIECSLR